LTEELVRQGHEVTLFASGDSETSARLIAPCAHSLRLDTGCVDQLAHQVRMLELVFRHAHEFDLIHFHIDYFHFPLSRRQKTPHVTTLHGRLDIPDLQPLYREFPEMPVISISNAQRAPLPWVNWVANVYHGLPRDLYELREQRGKYLLFLGRICADKGCDLAIEIARRAGRELVIAAKVDAADREYYTQEIEPRLDHPLVRYIGEVGGEEKNELLGNAYALLFPIQWPEPFGLVMIEAMACGTPVIAFRHGSVPEVMEDGVTGYITDTLEEAVQAVERAGMLDRRRCRQVFERRFTADRMARDYLDVYERLLGGGAAS
jgi:glycosyltransferase involved in cell wall biosynthesis